MCTATPCAVDTGFRMTMQSSGVVIFFPWGVRFCHFLRLMGVMSETEQFKADYLCLQPLMQHVAERLLGDEDKAADVVQDCFVTLWREHRSMARLTNRKAYCMTMVKHRCIDLIRSQRRTISIDSIDLQYNDIDDVMEQRIDTALRMVDRLPERQARVVRLRHYDALATSDIAAAMKITENNVYTLLSRAYGSLKKMILEYER